MSATIFGTRAYAGEINAQEARLVSEASGTFSHEGKTYRASAQYVDELRSYLCEEDVDLTAEDVDVLISDMYANVEAGVQEGYLEEVAGTDLAETGAVESETGAVEPEGEAVSEASPEAEAPAEEPEQPTYTVESTPEQTQIVDADGSVIFSAAPMIKNVGYHTQPARAWIVLGILFAAAILTGTTMVIRNEKS